MIIIVSQKGDKNVIYARSKEINTEFFFVKFNRRTIVVSLELCVCVVWTSRVACERTRESMCTMVVWILCRGVWNRIDNDSKNERSAQKFCNEQQERLNPPVTSSRSISLIKWILISSLLLPYLCEHIYIYINIIVIIKYFVVGE